MIRIFFDVSTNLMFVGLSENENLIDTSHRVSNQDHAKYLVDRIDNLLIRNQYTINDVDEIIVGVGPGSYTGIRIAVTVAKTLGYAKNILVKTISSLYFLSSDYEDKVCAMIDARRGFVFAQIHENEKIILKDTYISLEELTLNDDYKEAQSVLINEETYKVNINKILKLSNEVNDIHDLVPNYLRKTQAENELKND